VKNLIKITVVVGGLALMFLCDVMSLRLVPEAEAVLGVRRRTARRTAVVVGSASAAEVSAANASAAASQQQAAAAQQQAAAAQQQPAPQPAAAQQPAAASAPTAMVASLPKGCVADGAVFKCGDVYYKAYMAGNEIVYGVVSGP
jgi:biotin carboxyl carrier protein